MYNYHDLHAQRSTCTCIHMDMYLPCSSIFAHGFELVQNFPSQYQIFELAPKACSSIREVKLHILLIHGFKKSDRVMANFILVWWANLLPFGKVLQSLFVSLLSFALILQRRCTGREKSSNDAKSIAWIRFASNLLLLRNCNSCTANCSQAVCNQMITFFKFAAKTNGVCNEWPEKNPFQQTYGINNEGHTAGSLARFKDRKIRGLRDTDTKILFSRITKISKQDTLFNNPFLH